MLYQNLLQLPQERLKQDNLMDVILVGDSASVVPAFMMQIQKSKMLFNDCKGVYVLPLALM